MSSHHTGSARAVLSTLCLGLALGLGAPPPAAAQATASEADTSGGWGARLGYHNDYSKLGLVYETPTWWSYRFQDGWGRLDLGAELEVAYWRARHGRPDSMWQAGATPMLRWWPSERFYAEVGVGVTVLSRTSFADKQLGSAFQFGNHVGVGTVFGKAHRIGVRYSHYSNAGIKKPNPGLDIIELTYTYQF